MLVRRWAVAGLVAMAVAVFAGMGIARLHVDTSAASFLPEDQAEVQNLDRLARTFGSDPVVVLIESPSGRSPLSPSQLPRLLKAEGLLARLENVTRVYGPATTLNQIAIKAQQLLAQISGYRDGLRDLAERSGGQGRSEGLPEAERAVATFEKRYGSLLVRNLSAGLPTLHNPQFVTSVVYGGSGKPRAQWHHFVPSRGSVALFVRPRGGLDQASSDRLVRQVERTVGQAGLDTRRVTVTGLPAVTANLASQVRSEIPLLAGAALVAVAACLVAFPWTPRRRHRLWPLVPMLAATCLTLGYLGWRDRPVSLGVVAFLPVLLGIGTYYPVYLAQRRNRRLVLTVACASAAAFASLAVSPLPFVRDLGLAVALGIVVVTVISLVGSRFLEQQSPQVGIRSSSPPPPEKTPRKAKLAIVLTIGLSSIAGWALLPQMGVVTEPESLVGDLPEFAEARYVQARLGYSTEVTVLLSGDDVVTPAGLNWLHRVENRVVTEHGNVLRPIASPRQMFGFLGSSPTQAQVDAGLRLVPSYIWRSVVTRDRTHAGVTFGSRLESLNEHGDLIASLDKVVPQPPRGYEVRVVGLPVAAQRGLEAVAAEKYTANLLGIAAAVTVLLIGIRPRRDALRAAAAAGLATGMGICALWIVGAQFTPVTLALGSLTAAVGCEFAALLVAAQRSQDVGLGRSVWLAASVSGLGYAALCLSELSVIRQLGLVLAGSVALALLAAHVVAWGMPALRALPRTTPVEGAREKRHLVGTR